MTTAEDLDAVRAALKRMRVGPAADDIAAAVAGLAALARLKQRLAELKKEAEAWRMVAGMRLPLSIVECIPPEVAELIASARAHAAGKEQTD